MKSGSHDSHIDYATLNDFADGDLAGRASETVRAHLRECAACREAVQFIRAAGETIRTLPAPKPPDALLADLFREGSRHATVLPLVGAQAKPALPSRSLWLPSIGVGVLGLIATIILLTLGSGQAMAGASTLSFEPTRDGTLALRYETVSVLAGEPSLRARIRYWVPDSLRYMQTTPGFSAIELSRERLGEFEGVASLPPGTAYAVVTIEDPGADYIDNSPDGPWEYFETDAQGRPTLWARRYQMLATLNSNPTGIRPLAAQAASEFPGQPEFWVWGFLFSDDHWPASPPDTLLLRHAERLTALDRAARAGDPGPVEMDALWRYSRFLERTDLADHWANELVARYPRHGLSTVVTLRSIITSSGTDEEKLAAVEETWALTEAPAAAQVGLQISYAFADPDLTEKWLVRQVAAPIPMSLDYDIRVAGAVMEIPVLWPVAERWILRRLADSRDWAGPARRLGQSRRSFEAEARQGRALLYLHLSRIRLARSDPYAATDAVERAVAESWNPGVFVQAADFHRAAGSEARAAELIALARVDPVTPLEPYLSAAADSAWPESTETQLAAARITLLERIEVELLDEHVDLDARIRSETGEEVTLRRAAAPQGVTVVLYTSEPDRIPVEASTLLDVNAGPLRGAGVRTVVVTQRPGPLPEGRSGPYGSFYQDSKQEVREVLRASGNPEYFVLDGTGRLRHRGENLETALRIALVLST
ncbi:zf-HC2 domain-containing protein [Candidatus Palauibacter sp.]|uniref:zf-HC2 domain-containing protein n=1 Tax=Candidatus Palauibacter sp. TaxID=3101350 RepID=UPI003B52E02E